MRQGSLGIINFVLPNSKYEKYHTPAAVHRITSYNVCYTKLLRDAEVKGLNEFPEDERPPVLITHLSFQLMVGLGGIMALTGLLFLIFVWKKPRNNFI